MQSIWRRGNRFTLTPEGKHYVPELLAAIDGASQTILFEQYLMESGRMADMFIDALAKAASRGVRVHVLLDYVGAKGLEKHDKRRLVDAGIALRFFNPLSLGQLNINLTRDHRKLLLVDNDLAFTGGFCITDDFLDEWYDLALRIEGPVVQDWFALFARLWASSLTRDASKQSQIRNPMVESSPSRFSNPGMCGRVIWGRGRRYQAIRFSLQRRISTATRRVWVYTPYFLPTISLRRCLMAAAQRGVDVRLLVAGKDHDHPSVRYAGQSYFGRLLRAGVRIHEYQPSFTHAKFCVIDDWCTIGSCNFDHWSLRWNLEANQEVEDADFAHEAATLYSHNIDHSKEILKQDWAARPVWQKLLRQLTGKISAWLTLLR